MDNESAHQTLEQLQLEINKLTISDVESKARIDQLVTDVERQLANPQHTQDTKNLLERVEQSTEQFEVEHPQISGILNRLMVALSNMGI